MPTYVYETVPPDSSQEPLRFEVFQSMTENALTHDPASGLPVRRIITGGNGVKLGVLRRSTVVNRSSAAATACGCASGRPHRH